MQVSNPIQLQIRFVEIADNTLQIQPFVFESGERKLSQVLMLWCVIERADSDLR